MSTAKPPPSAHPVEPPVLDPAAPAVAELSVEELPRAEDPAAPTDAAVRPSPAHFRTMRPAEDGLPALGPASTLLGVRTPGNTPSDKVDITPDDRGYVHPMSGGLSVRPSIAAFSARFRPPEHGGQGRVPIFKLPAEGMERGLGHRPDPDDELHGFIEPSASMPLAEYETAIESTRPQWRRA